MVYDFVLVVLIDLVALLALDCWIVIRVFLFGFVLGLYRFKLGLWLIRGLLTGLVGGAIMWFFALCFWIVVF